ncbi:MAG: hypothetical protein PUP91_24575 [Rhizonema sp. PD37]|nr:hypothetical protein [Rhizonema sp. PD37]
MVTAQVAPQRRFSLTQSGINSSVSDMRERTYSFSARFTLFDQGDRQLYQTEAMGASAAKRD